MWKPIRALATTVDIDCVTPVTQEGKIAPCPPDAGEHEDEMAIKRCGSNWKLCSLT